MKLPAEQWILTTLYEAGKDQHDTYRLFQSLRKHIHTVADVSSMLKYSTTEIHYKPIDELADDCFFVICKFCAYLNLHAKRTGAPDCRFYSRLGRESFNQTGYPNIAEDWSFWVSYVQERFNI